MLAPMVWWVYTEELLGLNLSAISFQELSQSSRSFQNSSEFFPQAYLLWTWCSSSTLWKPTDWPNSCHLSTPEEIRGKSRNPEEIDRKLANFLLISSVFRSICRCSSHFLAHGVVTRVGCLGGYSHSRCKQKQLDTTLPTENRHTLLGKCRSNSLCDRETPIDRARLNNWWGRAPIN